MAPKHHETGIVLLAEKFEGGSVGEGVDVVFLAEADAVGAFEGVEVGQEGVG